MLAKNPTNSRLPNVKRKPKTISAMCNNAILGMSSVAVDRLEELADNDTELILHLEQHVAHQELPLMMDTDNRVPMQECRLMTRKMTTSAVDKMANINRMGEAYVDIIGALRKCTYKEDRYLFVVLHINKAAIHSAFGDNAQAARIIEYLIRNVRIPLPLASFLHCRLGHYLFEMGYHDMAVKHLALSVRALGQQSISTVEDVIADLVEKIVGKSGKNSDKILLLKAIKSEELTKDMEHLFPKINSHVKLNENLFEIRETNNMGHGVFALEDINAGAEILCEKAFAAVVNHEKYQSVCHYCIVTCSVYLMCPKCHVAVFCSNACFEAAKGFHRHECTILEELYMMKPSVNMLLALRLVTQSTLSEIRKVSEMTKTSHLKRCSYAYVYHKMCTNRDSRKVGELVIFANIAMLLVRLLRRTAFFGKRNVALSKQNELPTATPFSKDERLVISTIMRHLQVLQYNIHEISEINPSANNAASGTNRSQNWSADTVDIGAALYPTLSHFNHSCDAHLIRIQKGSEVIVRTVRPIKSDGQIFENYGVQYYSVPRASRLEYLQKSYAFNCCCNACANDFPILEDMASHAVRCNGCLKITTMDEDELKPYLNTAKNKKSNTNGNCKNCQESLDLQKYGESVMDINQMEKEALFYLGNLKFEESLQTYSSILNSDIWRNVSVPDKKWLQYQGGAKVAFMQLGNIGHKLVVNADGNRRATNLNSFLKAIPCSLDKNQEMLMKATWEDWNVDFVSAHQLRAIHVQNLDEALDIAHSYIVNKMKLCTQ